MPEAFETGIKPQKTFFFINEYQIRISKKPTFAD
jgi:hypothetical protein